MSVSVPSPQWAQLLASMTADEREVVLQSAYDVEIAVKTMSPGEKFSVNYSLEVLCAVGQWLSLYPVDKLVIHWRAK